MRFLLNFALAVVLLQTGCNPEGIESEYLKAKRAGAKKSGSSDAQVSSAEPAAAQKNSPAEKPEAEASDEKKADRPPTKLSAPPQASAVIKNAGAEDKVVVTGEVLPAKLTRSTKATATFSVSNPQEQMQGLFGTFTLQGEKVCAQDIAGSPPEQRCTSEREMFQRRVDVTDGSTFAKGKTSRSYPFDVPNVVFQNGKVEICFNAFTDRERKNPASADICWEAEIK
ncbi:MAG: hypothetical protein EBR09_10300 [Proteobacteria bacterium]|nr:hypothetical protein [Pseudomonadota bacterium]